MGLLVEGKWHDVWYSTSKTEGRFERSPSQFRHWITRDGSPGPDGKGDFKAEPNRYHLYVSLACPWAHRTLIYRKLKKLEKLITVSVVHHHLGKDGWTFRADDGGTGDHLYGLNFLHEIYTRADPLYSGRVTVPVLWDRRMHTMVSNESSEIIRMMNSAFDEWGDASVDFYPKPLRKEIDDLNAMIYPAINNGVYRAGFATTQQAYEEAFENVFTTLDRLEQILSKRRYLTGNRITEADWRLFTTLLRFDVVYVGHFKCNLHRIADYKQLSNYLRDLYQVPGVAETVDIDQIKKHYYGSHHTINPTGIVPKGPQTDFTAPHDRDRFKEA